jgi:hypothetical protein
MTGSRNSSIGRTPENDREAEFATFWHGPLNATTWSCLASFPAAGAILRLYTYETGIDSPEGVEVADARSICADISLLRRYIVGGRPSSATFSDRFRYSLIQQTGCCWVDADIICLRSPGFAHESIVWGRQSEAHGKALINNAVLKLPHDHPVLDEMLAKSEAAVDADLSWGALGPFLLTEVAERHGVYGSARDPSEFYPVGPDLFWKMLLPKYHASVEVAVRNATFLHLWSELLRRCEYDPSVAPPVGSYLHDIFRRIGTLDKFDRVYDEQELANMLVDWIPQEITLRQHK